MNKHTFDSTKGTYGSISTSTLGWVFSFTNSQLAW